MVVQVHLGRPGGPRLHLSCRRSCITRSLGGAAFSARPGVCPVAGGLPVLGCSWGRPAWGSAPPRRGMSPGPARALPGGPGRVDPWVAPTGSGDGDDSGGVVDDAGDDGGGGAGAEDDGPGSLAVIGLSCCWTSPVCASAWLRVPAGCISSSDVVGGGCNTGPRGSVSCSGRRAGRFRPSASLSGSPPRSSIRSSGPKAPSSGGTCWGGLRRASAAGGCAPVSGCPSTDSPRLVVLGRGWGS